MRNLQHGEILLDLIKKARLNIGKYRTTLIWGGVFLLVVSFRVFLIEKYPVVFSWDAFTRLWEYEYIIVRHWLPLPQLPIFLAHHLQFDLFTVRTIYAIISSIAPVAFGISASRRWGINFGLLLTLFLSFLSTYVKFSIVPYQEGMALSFLGLFLLFGPGFQKIQDRFYFVAGIMLALAALCRYEMWMFVFIVSLGGLVRKEWKLLISFLPAYITIAAWLVISLLLDIQGADGPPRTVSEAAFADTNTLTDFVMVSQVFFPVIERVIAFISADLFLIGTVFSIAGVFYVFLSRKSLPIEKELILFWLGLFILTTIRGINTKGIVTDRMVVLFTFVSVIFAVYAFHGLTTLLSRYLKHVAVFLAWGGAAMLFFLWSERAVYSTAVTAAAFGPEAQAAKILEKIPKDKTVAIIPRPMVNILQESTVGAIFANGFGSIDNRNMRWLFQPRKPDGMPAFLLRWEGRDGYVLRQMRDVYPTNGTVTGSR